MVIDVGETPHRNYVPGTCKEVGLTTHDGINCDDCYQQDNKKEETLDPFHVKGFGDF
jgi:hypothetical protein